MTRLTSQELEKLLREENWKELWAQAVPWVKFAASKLRIADDEDREDLVQDGLMEVGRQLKNWNPEIAKFSTFCRMVSNSMMWKVIERKSKRTAGAVSMHDDDTLFGEGGAGAAIAPTYESTEHVPEGFGDPAVEIARELARESAETLLTELNASDSLKLREYLGLPTFENDSEPVQIKDMGASRGVSRFSVNRELIKLHELLHIKQQERYMNNSTEKPSIYPPEGKLPWRTHIPANWTRPGFFHGLANEMGDVDVWRESTGTVWKDWSWKPTDNDILNGAKP